MHNDFGDRLSGMRRLHRSVIGGFSLIGLAAGSAMLVSVLGAPAAVAQNVNQSVLDMAKPWGKPGGRMQAYVVPPGALIRTFVVYADASSEDRQIYGIQLMYQDQAGGAPIWSPVIGSTKGVRHVSNITSPSQVNRLTVWTSKFGGLAGVHLVAGGVGAGRFSKKYSSKRTFGFGSRSGLKFGGITARADNERIYALGIIAIDPNNPYSNPVWARNVPSGGQPGASSPPQFAQNSQPSQQTWSGAQNQWSSGQSSQQAPTWQQPAQPPQQQQAPGWAGQSQQQQPPQWAQQQQSQGWNGQSQQPSQWPQQQAQQQQPQQPGWAGQSQQQPGWNGQPQQQQQSQQQFGWNGQAPSAPPSSGFGNPNASGTGANGGFNGGNTSSYPGGFTGSNIPPGGPPGIPQSGQQQPAIDPREPILGYWVAANSEIRRSGDGVRQPISYDAPTIIRFTKGSGNSNVNLTSDYQMGRQVLSRQSDSFYSGSGMSARISRSGSTLFLNLTGAGPKSGSYVQARTAEGELSKNRFKVGRADGAAGSDPFSGGGARDSRRGLFNQEGLSREWINNFYSYDGLNMNLFDFVAGRKVNIFAQPDAQGYAIDDNLGLGLVYGLRGMPVRSSRSRQTEALITNAATFQREMSMNFGGGVSTPKGGFGAKYSYSKTTGTRTGSSTMKAIGIARVERYVLMLDAPNAQLSDGFRRSVQQLADGAMSPSRFREIYGTHYAAAIVYGGLGKAEKDMTSNEISSYMSEKYGASANGNVGPQGAGANLDGGFSQGTSSSNSNSSVFKQEDFVAVGGSGSFNANNWQVSDRDTVPVRYDLRRLSELISPLYFEMKDYNTFNKYLRASNALRKEIDRYMSGIPPFPNRNIGPKIYQVDFHNFRCARRGDEGEATVEVAGTLTFGWHGDNGVQSIKLFDQPSYKNFTCGGTGESLTQKALIMLSPNGRESRQSGFGHFYTVAGQMYEVDDGIKKGSAADTAATIASFGIYKAVQNADDKILAQGASGQIKPLSSVAGRGRQTATFGKHPAPTMTLTYTVTELK